MEKDNLKESTLINLRCVTLSAKGGVPLSHLQNDYKKLIGAYIPVQNLGYNTLEAFLRDIPDVIKLKKDLDGQLLVEGVASASTVHLSKLISKQKNIKAKSAPVLKRCHLKRTPLNNSSSSTLSSNSSCSCEEKSKIIQDLNMKLQKEKKINKDFSSQMIRLNSLVKTGQDSLFAEQILVKQLKHQLDNSEVSSTEQKTAVDTKLISKELTDLKMELENERKSKLTLTSQVNFLTSLNQTRLKGEKELVLKLKQQVGTLQEKILLNYIASSNVSTQVSDLDTEILKRIGILDGFLNTLASASIKELEPPKSLSIKNTEQDDSSTIFSLFQEQCQQMQQFKTRLQQQDIKMQNIERKLQQQQDKTKNVEQKQNQQFQKLSTQIQTNSKSLNMNDLWGKLVKHLQTQSLNQVSQNTHVANQSSGSEILKVGQGTSSTKNNVMCEPNIISAKKFDVSTKYISPGISAISGPVKKKKKRKKKSKTSEIPLELT